MARSDDSAPLGRPPKLGRKLFLARLSLAWESLWPALWPAVGIGGVFLALALFDFFPHVPGWLHVLLLAAFAIFFFRTLIKAIRSFSWPARHAGRRRIEQASGLDHRPLTAVNDSQATGTNDRDAAALWQAHQARMAALSRNLRAGIPEPGLARRDPWALRLALAITLVVAGIAGSSDPLQRLSRAVMPTLQPPAMYTAHAFYDSGFQLTSWPMLASLGFSTEPSYYDMVRNTHLFYHCRLKVITLPRKTRDE